jgi:hypothetical protein
MKPAFALLCLPLLGAAPASAVTPEAEAFMAAVEALAPVSCERRRLRRELAVARRERFEAIARDPETARLDQRVGELHRRLVDASGRVRDPEDLHAIGAQQRELFAQCQ